MSSEKLTGQQIADAGLDGWAVLAGVLHTRIRTKDFVSALAIVDSIGAAAEEMNHHPDLDLRWGRVDVRLSSHDVGGLTDRDVRLARRITGIAADAGAGTSAEGLSVLELGLDTPDHTAISPFWQAVLLMEPVRSDDLADPAGVTPAVWFQASGDEPDRQRWHPDVWIDPAEVRPRIAAAVAAGGTLVSDADAPRFWVLADPQGNKVCLCTWQERG